MSEKPTIIEVDSVMIKEQGEDLKIAPVGAYYMILNPKEQKALKAYFAAKFIGLLNHHYDRYMAQEPGPYDDGGEENPRFAYMQGFAEGIADSADVIRIAVGLDEMENENAS